MGTSPPNALLKQVHQTMPHSCAGRRTTLVLAFLCLAGWQHTEGLVTHVSACSLVAPYQQDTSSEAQGTHHVSKWRAWTAQLTRLWHIPLATAQSSGDEASLGVQHHTSSWQKAHREAQLAQEHMHVARELASDAAHHAAAGLELGTAAVGHTVQAAGSGTGHAVKRAVEGGVHATLHTLDHAKHAVDAGLQQAGTAVGEATGAVSEATQRITHSAQGALRHSKDTAAHAAAAAHQAAQHGLGKCADSLTHVAEGTAHAVQDAAHQCAEVLSEGGHLVKHQVKQAGALLDSVGHRIQSAAESVEAKATDAASDAAHMISGVAHEAWNTAQQVAQGTAQQVQQAASAMEGTVAQVAATGQGLMSEVLQDAKHVIHTSHQQLTQTSHVARHTIETSAERAAGAAAGAVHAAQHVIQGAASNAQAAGHHAASLGQHAAAAVQQAAVQGFRSAQHTAESAQHVVGHVTDAVSGVAQSLQQQAEHASQQGLQAASDAVHKGDAARQKLGHTISDAGHRMAHVAHELVRETARQEAGLGATSILEHDQVPAAPVASSPSQHQLGSVADLVLSGACTTLGSLGEVHAAVQAALHGSGAQSAASSTANPLTAEVSVTPSVASPHTDSQQHPWVAWVLSPVRRALTWLGVCPSPEELFPSAMRTSTGAQAGVVQTFSWLPPELQEVLGPCSLLLAHPTEGTTLGTQQAVEEPTLGAGQAEISGSGSRILGDVTDTEDGCTNSPEEAAAVQLHQHVMDVVRQVQLQLQQDHGLDAQALAQLTSRLPDVSMAHNNSRNVSKHHGVRLQVLARAAHTASQLGHAMALLGRPDVLQEVVQGAVQETKDMLHEVATSVLHQVGSAASAVSAGAAGVATAASHAMHVAKEELVSQLRHTDAEHTPSTSHDHASHTRNDRILDMHTTSKSPAGSSDPELQGAHGHERDEP